jgi:hypothetical protein
MATLLVDDQVEISLTGEGLVLIRLFGGLATAPDAERLYDRVGAVLGELAPARVLIDLGGFQEASLSARWALAMCLRGHRGLTERAACYGLRPGLDLVASIVIRTSGRDNIAIFRNRADAQRWLLDTASSSRAAAS